MGKHYNSIRGLYNCQRHRNLPLHKVLHAIQVEAARTHPLTQYEGRDTLREARKYIKTTVYFLKDLHHNHIPIEG